MTINTTINKHILAGDGVNLVFQFQFLVSVSTHLVVIHTDVDGNDTYFILDSDYTIADVGNPAGGSITLLGSAPTLQETITLVRVVPLKQEVDYENQGGYFPDTLEGSVDQLTMISQQHQEELDRCPSLAVSSTESTSGWMDEISAASSYAADAAESAADAAAYAETAKAPCVPWIVWASNSTIEIKAGTEADADDGTMRMAVTSPITVDTDISGAGGLDTGVIANGIYQIWLIYCPTGPVTEGLLVRNQYNQAAPVMPAGYTKKRCIGFVERAAGNLTGFHQAGDQHWSAVVSNPVFADPGVSPGTDYDLKLFCARQITASAIIRFELKPDAANAGQLSMGIPGGSLIIAEMVSGADEISLAPIEFPLIGTGGDHEFTVFRTGTAWNTIFGRLVGFKLKFPALIKTGTP